MSIITTSIVISNPDLYSWPITITNPSDTVSLSVSIANITLTSDKHYFIITNNNTTLTGTSGNNVTLDNIINYPGLVKCSPSTLTNIRVQQITMLCQNSTLLSGGGWIGQRGWLTIVSEGIAAIASCKTDGAISINSGGICGQFTTCRISNCSTTGDINENAGGIINNANQGFINYCTSSGNISRNGGGIASTAISCNFNNCSSLGNIGINAAGIANTALGCSISSCTSSGNIVGSNASGIAIGDNTRVLYCWYTGNITSPISAGLFYANGTGSNQIYRSYSIGQITAEQCGGLVYGKGNSTTLITSSYYSGNVPINSYAIFNGIGTITMNFCYCLNSPMASSGSGPSYTTNGGAWSDSDAIEAFTLGGVPTSFISIMPNTPYLINNNNYNNQQYTPSSINVGNTPFTINPNVTNQTNYQIYNFVPQLPNILMNSVSGQITDIGETTSGSYILQIISTQGGIVNSTTNTYYNYNAMPYTINVSAACFEENTLILTSKGQIKIKDLEIGDLVKIYTSNPDVDEYKSITHLFKSTLQNNLLELRTKDSMYEMDDLKLTGGHSLLVDDLTFDEENIMLEYWPTMCKTNDKYLLLSLANENFVKINNDKLYNICHFILNSDDDTTIYGIYAGNNNILCETMTLDYYNKNK